MTWGRRARPALLAALCALAAPARAAPTVVTLCFDDGWADQAAAGALLSQRGLRATFFVSSSLLSSGAPGALTLADARALAAAGQEIGGHSLSHPDLAALAADQAASEVCGDRQALLALGFDARTFAYPYGSYTGAAEQAVRGCGYDGARALGGLSCAGCPAAERLPPVDAYAVATPDPPRAGATLAGLQAPVTAAEAAGGGWVPLVLHRVCDGCAPGAVPPEVLAAFLDWLKSRASRGTVVRTFGEALGAPAGAAAPPEPAAATSLDAVRVFPNPWRADLHGGLSVTIDGLTPRSEVRIYTVSGRWVRTLDAPAGVARWDLQNDSGARVASGLYLYLVTDEQGNRRKGTVAVIR